MRKVEKYIKLYRENEITVQQAHKQLGGRKYREFWNKLYKLAAKK